jgi:3-oxoacyl-[acyl-carrier-protein] synthase-3
MDRLGVHPNLLRALSGIEARRFWDEGAEPSDVATQAAELAIERAGIDRQQLGILINTSVCRDYIEPSTACIVHGNLKLGQHCMNFDLANACLGFLNGMDMIANMIDRGQVDYGIVVDGEGSRFVTESTIARLLDPSCDDEMFRTNFATLTLGSGAAAMVLCRSDLAPDGHRFLGGVNLAATQHCRLCHGQPDHMVTDTKALLIAGLELAAKTWAAARAELSWTVADLDHFVMHQVSKVHTEKVAGILGLDLAKIYAIYPEYGNIGPASIPIVLAKLLEENKLAKGHRVALMGIGSGLNCTMAEAVW